MKNFVLLFLPLLPISNRFSQNNSVDEEKRVAVTVGI
jgi:hypothetical protein